MFVWGLGLTFAYVLFRGPTKGSQKGIVLGGSDGSERGNFKLVALYIGSILEGLIFLGPGC